MKDSKESFYVSIVQVRVLKQFCSLLSVLGLTLFSNFGYSGQPDNGGTTPPHSNAFGKDLSEWMNVFWTDNLSGGDGKEGRVTLLEVPGGDVVGGDGSEENPLILEGELDVELGVGSPFVLGVLTWIGESYVDECLPDDEPLGPDLFLEADVVVTLDDQTLIDSETDELSDYYYDATFFDSPISEGYPQCRESDEDDNCLCEAGGAIWVQGLGFINQPLAIGEHTLHLTVGANFFGFHVVFVNTWNITVSP